MTTFTERARLLADPYWQGSFEHPFVTGLQSGELAAENFRYYLLQDWYYLEHFSKLYDLIGQKTQDKEVKVLMAENSRNLAAGELFVRETFFDELQITQGEIDQTPVAQTAYHYVSHLYRQLLEGGVAVACAGMLPCPWLYQEIGEKMIRQGSPNPLYQRWIATYATAEGARHLQRERQIVDRLYEAADKKQQAQMLQAFYISSQLEYQFWEMALTLETWPTGAKTSSKEAISNGTS